MFAFAYAASTCPLSKVTPESVFASKVMFYMGNVILIAACAGVLIFAFSFLPKIVRTCSISKLLKARKIIILYGDKHVYTEGAKYVLQVSMAGWNFFGEEKNSRRLTNNMQVMKAIDSIIDNANRPV